MPKGFVIGKPIKPESYDESEIYALEREGRLVITRKRDRYKLYAHIDKDGVHLYTAGMNSIDGRLGHIERDIIALHMPAGTLLVGEGIMDLGGQDDFSSTVSVFKGSIEKSLQFQKKNGKMKFMIFDVPAHEGRWSSLSYRDRLIFIKRHLCHTRKLRHLITPEVLTCSFDEAKQLVIDRQWEGLVLYGFDFVNSYRLDGKYPPRPKGCYKWKPIIEDDFIVREWIPNPEDPDRLKELVLLQIDPVTNEEFRCANLGTFSNAIRTRFRNATYPLVVQVAFESRFPKSGKLRNARFMRVRTDKPLHECIAPQNYAEREVTTAFKHAA